jgi:hypothetical protein
MINKITDTQIEEYFSNLPLYKKIDVLPSDLKKSFCNEVIVQIYEPFWSKTKNMTKSPHLPDSNITEQREKILKENYLALPEYRESLIISMLIEKLPDLEKYHLEKDSLKFFKDEWRKSGNRLAGPNLNEVREAFFKERYH